MCRWLYKKDCRNKHRYILGTKGYNPLITFGINPSTARPGDLDPTVSNTEKLSIHNKNDSWIMLNIYPQRSTDPNGMDTTLNSNQHRKNLRCIEDVFKINKGAVIIAAWGNLITKRKYLVDCLGDIYDLSLKYNMIWNCIDINQTGNPKHPLYVSIPKVVLKPFNVKQQYGF